MGATVLNGRHNSIETGAAATLGNRNSVHIKLDSKHTTLIALAHLVGDIEHEGGVHTVVKLHVHLHIVRMGVGHLFSTRYSVGLQVADAESEQTATYYIYLLVIIRAVLLHSYLVVDGDGIASCPSAVQRRCASHSRQSGAGIDTYYAPSIVVQDNLGQVDIG